MLKNKKLLISLILSVLLIVSAVVLVWAYALNKSNEGDKNIEDNIEISIKNDNDGMIIKDLSSGIINVGENLLNEVPDLDREIVIEGDFTAEVNKIFRQRLQEQIALLKKNNMDFDGWMLLGTLRKMVEDYDGAKEAWVFASLLKPSNSVPFNNLGVLYGFYLKDLPKAEENYLISIANDPKNAQAYGDLADLYWADKIGQKQERIESLLKKGIEANVAQNKNVLVAKLAKYYDDIKDFGNAIKYYELFLKSDPNNIDVQERLDQIKSL